MMNILIYGVFGLCFGHILAGYALYAEYPTFLKWFVIGAIIPAYIYVVFQN